MNMQQHKTDSADTETILVVEDESVNLARITYLLNEMGLQVITAQDGASAIAKAQQEQPALILLDVMLPDFNGFEACQRLKAEAATRAIPIIFMTALSLSGDKMKGFSMGAADYITKPIESEEFIARITTHLTVLRQQAEIASLKQRLEACEKGPRG